MRMGWGRWRLMVLDLMAVEMLTVQVLSWWS